jgi:hypothetical protein
MWENADRHPGDRAYDITLDMIEGSAGSLVALVGQEYLHGVSEMQKIFRLLLGAARTVRYGSGYVSKFSHAIQSETNRHGYKDRTR